MRWPTNLFHLVNKMNVIYNIGGNNNKMMKLKLSIGSAQVQGEAIAHNQMDGGNTRCT